MSTRTQPKPCQWRDGCAAEAIFTERFCAIHRRAMLREMEQSGYLAPFPRQHESRGQSAREDVIETKYGPEP